MTTGNPFSLDPTPASTPEPAPITPPVAVMTAPAPALVTSPAVAPAPAYPPGGDDPFSGPAPQQPRGPRIRDVYGRLLLIIPHKLEEGVPNRLQSGTTQDRMTADVITLDGGPIPYGGAPEATPPVPHDKTAQVPHKTARQFISQAGLISQCREALAKRMRGEPGMVLGRLTVGEKPANGGNPPYLLTPPTEQDKQLARQYLATVDPFA